LNDYLEFVAPVELAERSWLPVEHKTPAEVCVSIDRLLNAGAQINAVCGCRTPLHRVCSWKIDPFNRGSISEESVVVIVRFLLTKGADSNVPNRRGATAIFDALMSKYGAVVRVLLDHNARVNVWGVYKGRQMTPLHMAAWLGDAASADIIIQKARVDGLPLPEFVNSRGPERGGLTPLSLAKVCTRSRSDPVGVIQLLQRYGATDRVTEQELSELRERVAGQRHGV
jgi:ankyrin repeat protein